MMKATLLLKWLSLRVTSPAYPGDCLHVPMPFIVRRIPSIRKSEDLVAFVVVNVYTTLTIEPWLICAASCINYAQIVKNFI